MSYSYVSQAKPPINPTTVQSAFDALLPAVAFLRREIAQPYANQPRKIVESVAIRLAEAAPSIAVSITVEHHYYPYDAGGDSYNLVPNGLHVFFCAPTASHVGSVRSFNARAVIVHCMEGSCQDIYAANVSFFDETLTIEDHTLWTYYDEVVFDHNDSPKYIKWTDGLGFKHPELFKAQGFKYAADYLDLHYGL